MKPSTPLRTYLTPILFTVLILFCVAVVAPACEQGGPRGAGHGDKAAKLKEKLGLTDEQSEQIKAIMIDARTQIKSLREQTRSEGAADHKEMFAAAKEIRTNADIKVEALLTNSQLVLYKEFKEARKAKRLERRQRKQFNQDA